LLLVPLLLDLGSIGSLGPWLITAGSIVMTAICAMMWRRQPSLFLATMTLAAAAWGTGNIQWLQGAAIHRVGVLAVAWRFIRFKRSSVTRAILCEL